MAYDYYYSFELKRMISLCDVMIQASSSGDSQAFRVYAQPSSADISCSFTEMCKLNNKNLSPFNVYTIRCTTTVGNENVN